MIQSALGCGAVMASFVSSMACVAAAIAAPAASQRIVQVEHIVVASTKTFEAAAAALEAFVPELDPAIVDAMSNGDVARAKELARGSDLFIFLKRDHGAILRIYGRAGKELQYEIGNPMTAASMTRHQLPAALYAPLRLALYEKEGGGAIFEYDKPSSLFGQFGDAEVTAVGRALDAEMEKAVRKAAE